MSSHNQTYGASRLAVSGPFQARDKGLCNACVANDDALTKGGHIKSTAKVWTVSLGWVHVNLCAKCMTLLGEILEGDVAHVG